ncbi:aminopeptidase [Paenibacillus sp. J31TS4]|uniref:aminopeptidase n=1 Tax=Paenibacillus sp. J31TS4 TaxID=2807195 RepID=UPI001B2EF291|nr:aminopeptidase [Paenibacillus sp. J31TS4]GIP39438.1 aminopeptidase [Paenibacillus sp. J31TS4]
MATFEEQLNLYAELAVQVGLNVQKGQTIVINAPLYAAEFVRKLARAAYETGAKHVMVEWNDEELGRIKYLHAPDEAFLEFPGWRAQGLEKLAEEGAAFLTIYAPNPDLLKDVDPKRISDANKTAMTALKTYRHYQMTHQVAWSVISVPSEAWAQKVFPELPVEEGMQELWNFIFKALRIDTGNPIEAWQKHNAELRDSNGLLNERRFKQLIYTAPGTDLTIDLPDGHIWLGGAKRNGRGVMFNPNLPTEEVFTVPHKNGVNGTVRSTKPLVYSGQLIDGFSLTFENGRVVSFTAEQGEEALERMLNTDEGARRLGEVAIVPHASPISASNLVFYNTLFDENASSHLALGQAYQVNIEGGGNLTDEEMDAKGINQSLIHVDFMIGSGDMNIDGVTQDGERVPLVRSGNWVRE